MDSQRKIESKLEEIMDNSQRKIEVKLEVMMDNKMDVLKGEIMEGLKRFLMENPYENDNVSLEIHDEDTRNVNQD